MKKYKALTYQQLVDTIAEVFFGKPTTINKKTMDKRSFKIIEDKHAYELPLYTVLEGKGIEQLEGKGFELAFVRGNSQEGHLTTYRHGTLHEHLLAVQIHDLKLKHDEFPSKETACAITHLQEALFWLEERQRDREARGVIGTYQK